MMIDKQFGVSSATPAAVEKAAPAQPVAPEGRAASATESATGAADRVVVSSSTGRVASALEQAHADHAEKVARLTEAVRSGRYQVDASAVAHSMVEDSLSDAPSGAPASANSAPLS
jgi:flagellar biosynthesis anti-sigma factor FlgM